MLARAVPAQNETLERLKYRLSGKRILFTLVGSAACREYGLPREANDLDFVVHPYDQAIEILDESGEFEPVPDDRPDPTGRTCTKRHSKTRVKVDFLTGGIRINDGPVPFYCRDLIPIPMPTGVGSGSLRMLIAMKLNSAISGEYILSHGVRDGRSETDFKKDISDVRGLILVPGFDHNMKFDNEWIQRRYEELVKESV